ncbi:Chemotaxis protein methyltransferase [Gemmata obscuriglobus]|uniref:protein-glutamate O-methyltransferase n=1 Tax=Gemmata obscuriglobus TaxID=114 RepID=A0A2Z3GW97_9BACT|nr:protein-glutamate O-methyltransferase CheR [Gemmata obscuriglobus]AWM35656.1 protein-glutamate O-methyltransferase CheR [Gemmata obscuriglobus]QEG31816.1 Chemotaxis protein methyltransferase [Gemmata obscuriglobus]VTS11162.1 methyltransferase : Methyltransferase PilK OS=Pseudomonas stutzeri CCUG 29243 GN=A458_01560 PE=4 SV=1: CheR [Gemmata obscuriglobus UQM 2246]
MVELTDAEFARWRESVEERSGMSLGGARARVLGEVAAARARACGFAAPAEYARHLAACPAAPEWDRLLDGLLNGDTRFFRDPAAFAALTGFALPAARERRRREGGARVALWSAGCSTGPEAYSLGIACLSDPGLAGWQVEVVGTDRSPAALERARAGCYRAHELAAVPPGVLRRFFEAAPAGYRVGPDLRAVTRFEPCDLLGGGPARPPQDVIFCQNVLIYYRPEARGEILRRLTAALAPGGCLVLGPAEALGLDTPGLELVRLPDAWLYRRTA